MPFNEHDVNRSGDGKFAHKQGSEPAISLGDVPRATRRLLERYPQTRFTPGAGAPAEFTLQPEDIPAPLENPFKNGDRVVIPARTRIARVDSYWSMTGEVETTERKRSATVKFSEDGGYHTGQKGRREPFYWDGVDFVKPKVYWFGKDTVYCAHVTPELLVASGQPVSYNEEKRETFVRRFVEDGDFELRGFA